MNAAISEARSLYGGVVFHGSSIVVTAIARGLLEAIAYGIEPDKALAISFAVVSQSGGPPRSQYIVAYVVLSFFSSSGF